MKIVPGYEEETAAVLASAELLTADLTCTVWPSTCPSILLASSEAIFPSEMFHKNPLITLLPLSIIAKVKSWTISRHHTTSPKSMNARTSDVSDSNSDPV